MMTIRDISGRKSQTPVSESPAAEVKPSSPMQIARETEVVEVLETGMPFSFSSTLKDEQQQHKKTQSLQRPRLRRSHRKWPPCDWS